jgi:hypothetical protein
MLVIWSPDIAVTLTISALYALAATPGGDTVRLNGGVGIRAPSPVLTNIDVPEMNGDGGVSTRVVTKLFTLSIDMKILRML